MQIFIKVGKEVCFRRPRHHRIIPSLLASSYILWSSSNLFLIYGGVSPLSPIITGNDGSE